MTQPNAASGSRSHAGLFFRQWLRNPAGTASIAPSGRQLASLMTRQVPDAASRVIELGAGTGALTRALLARGLSTEQLLVLELNETLHGHLSEHFPEVNVVCGDAADLTGILAGSGFAGVGEVDAVVSSLGLLNMPKEVQRSIIASALSVLRPGAPFIQFTYSPVPPLSAALRSEFGLGVHRAGLAWRNLPPATVFVFSRAVTQDHQRPPDRSGD